MRNISSLRRVTLIALAVVQTAMPVLAAVADADLTANKTGGPFVHVEDHTQKSCRPPHSDDCSLCQLLTHFSAPRSAGPVVPSQTASRFSVRNHAARLPTSFARAHDRARAPPVSLS